MSLCLKCLIGTEDLPGHLCLPSPALTNALALAHAEGVEAECQRWQEDYRDIKHQLGDVVDTMTALEKKGRALRDKLYLQVMTGRGIYNSELRELHDEVCGLFPHGRVRKNVQPVPDVTPESPLDPGTLVG